LQEVKGSNIDNALLERFEEEIWSKVPHLDEKQAKVVNATPLIDLTEDLKECAKNVYNLNLEWTDNNRGHLRKFWDSPWTVI
jgi:hypothetical protein